MPIGNNSFEKELEEKYEKKFHPIKYVETLFPTKKLFPCFSNMLGVLHNIFSTHIREAETMLDLGCGPSIYGMISASKRVKRIVCSDFLENNLDEIRKWVDEKPEAFDWIRCFEEVARLENNPDIKKLEQRVRNTIKDFVQCDLRLPNPISPNTEQFDVVFVGFTFGSISSNYEMFAKHVSHGASLVKEGGYLIYSGLLRCGYYFVEDVKFTAFYARKEDVDNALVSAKLKPLLWATFPILEGEITPGDKYECSFVVLAKK